MTIQPRVTGFIEENCYLVTNPQTREVVVLDPGDDAGELAADIRGAGAAVAGYLITHGHVDHISALAALAAEFPASVYIHAEDAAWCFTEQNSIPGMYPPPKKPGAPIVLVKEGDVVELAGARWRVVETPGHTPGGVCWYLEEPSALFTGDTLFRGSAGRTDLPGGNSRVLGASLRKLAALPDELAIYPGHGEPSTIGHEKRTNYFMRF